VVRLSWNNSVHVNFGSGSQETRRGQIPRRSSLVGAQRWSKEEQGGEVSNGGRLILLGTTN
jgi:hypothetical protein